MRAGQIQVLEVSPLHAPPVEADHRSGFILERDDNAAVEVLVPALPPQSKLGEPRAQPFAFGPVFVGQPQPQCPVGKPDLEAVNQLVIVQAPARQIEARAVAVVAVCKDFNRSW